MFVFNLDTSKYASWIALASVCIGWGIKTSNHNIIFTLVKERLDVERSSRIEKGKGILRSVDNYGHSVN